MGVAVFKPILITTKDVDQRKVTNKAVKTEKKYNFDSWEISENFKLLSLYQWIIYSNYIKSRLLKRNFVLICILKNASQ